MELKEFIKSVLKDITEAVEESRTSSTRDMHLDSLKDQRTVEFDVAVTAEDVTSASGKAGVKVFSMIEGSGETAKEIKNSTVSRIKFGVYVDRWTKKENSSSNSFEQPDYESSGL
ncbi:MAG: hypothetical protein WC791_03625 [Candidatus Paceibacterota bacterium]|jgi:hypothetical protein